MFRAKAAPSDIPLPSQRKADLKKLAKLASSVDAAEQKRLSGALIGALAVEDDPGIRAEIVRTLGAYPTGEAAEAVRLALSDSDPDVKIAACQACVERRDSETVMGLSAALRSDTNLDVRLAAARALGDIGDQAALGALGGALDDGNPALRYRATVALGQVTGADLGSDVAGWRQYVQARQPDPRPAASLAERPRNANPL